MCPLSCALCEAFEPTTVPSFSPTSGPSVQPTISPTRRPTIPPTLSPSLPLTVEPTTYIPTVEPTKCEDVAEYSDVCRYSSTKCTCSDILELTTCDVPISGSEIFSKNMNACDLDLLL